MPITKLELEYYDYYIFRFGYTRRLVLTEATNIFPDVDEEDCTNNRQFRKALSRYEERPLYVYDYRYEYIDNEQIVHDFLYLLSSKEGDDSYKSDMIEAKNVRAVLKRNEIYDGGSVCISTRNSWIERGDGYHSFDPFEFAYHIAQIEFCAMLRPTPESISIVTEKESDIKIMVLDFDSESG